MIMDECLLTDKTLSLGKSMKPPLFLFWMYLGSIINSITELAVALDTTLFMALAIAAKSPADVVLNILGFKFLLTMDDIGGDMGFLQGLAWDGAAMSHLYTEYTSAADLNENDKIEDNIEKSKSDQYPNLFLSLTKGLLDLLALVLPLLLALCSNIKIKEEESGFDAAAIAANMTALQSQVVASNSIIAQLQSQVAALSLQLAPSTTLTTTLTTALTTMPR